MRRFFLVAGVLAFLLIVGVAVWVTLALRPERIREHLINAVNDRFAGRVDAESAQISVLPKPAISGTGVRIYLRSAAADLPPLVAIKSFEASAPYRGLVSPRVHLGNVTLTGTDIRIPPGGLSPAAASLDTVTTAESRRNTPIDIIIDEIVSRDARLEISTRKALVMCSRTRALSEPVGILMAITEFSRTSFGVNRVRPMASMPACMARELISWRRKRRSSVSSPMRRRASWRARMPGTGAV